MGGSELSEVCVHCLVHRLALSAPRKLQKRVVATICQGSKQGTDEVGRWKRGVRRVRRAAAVAVSSTLQRGQDLGYVTSRTPTTNTTCTVWL